eukprot:6608-Heterococcus_DN1.PRE.3
MSICTIFDPAISRPEASAMACNARVLFAVNSLCPAHAYAASKCAAICNATTYAVTKHAPPHLYTPMFLRVYSVGDQTRRTAR